MTRKSKAPVTLYSALADATRCRIIEIVAEGPIPVHRLADAFSISRPAISRHLRVLKQAGLVAEVKKGRENLYAFRPQKLEKAVSWIETFSAAGPTPTKKGAEASAPQTPFAAPPSPPITVPEVLVEPAAPVLPRAGSPKKSVPAPEGTKPVSINQMGFDF